MTCLAWAFMLWLGFWVHAILGPGLGFACDLPSFSKGLQRTPGGSRVPPRELQRARGSRSSWGLVQGSRGLGGLQRLQRLLGLLGVLDPWLALFKYQASFS